jgi:hypothetical protein
MFLFKGIHHMAQSLVKYGIFINATDVQVTQCKLGLGKPSLDIHQFTNTHNTYENVLKLLDGLIYKFNK